jgi:hypothetical protein
MTGSPSRSKPLTEIVSITAGLDAFCSGTAGAFPHPDNEPADAIINPISVFLPESLMAMPPRVDLIVDQPVEKRKSTPGRLWNAKSCLSR